VQWHEVRHQVAVSGRVTDGETGTAIQGAFVTIAAGPPVFMNAVALAVRRFGSRWAGPQERPDRARTGADGHFHFLDLPDGTYTLVSSLPEAGRRYGTGQVTVEVHRDPGGHVGIGVADMKLAPTSVRGTVTVTGGGPLLLAEVRIKGGEESCLTDAQGRYALRRIETGKRTILVSAPGFQAASRSVEVNAPGSSSVVDVALVSAGS
jgi:hypothetical protein